MKQPRSTRKERQDAKATNTAITEVGDAVKNNASFIVGALDQIVKRGLPDRVLFMLHPNGPLLINGRHGLNGGSREDLARVLAENGEVDLAAAVARGLSCEHIMLVVSLPSGIQGCCPECDYDVRGRKTN